ncbi:MAG: hypothetical protein ABSH53_22935 [Holophaga sp.]
MDLAAILDAAKLLGESKKAEVPPNDAGRDATIKRLAALHPLDYEKVREAEAAGLGCRQGVLDDLVKAARAQNPNQGGTKNGGSPALCPQTDLWPELVSPTLLLDEIKGTIQTFIVCDEEVAVAGTLWVAFTWFIDVVQVAPLVVITAPEPRCGKTQYLDLLGRLSRRPLIASNISPAAVFRVDKLDPQAGDLIRFLALSGLRKGEALGLRFADVDLERGVMRFEDHKTSEQAGTKVLPLNTHLKTILQRRLSQKLGVEAKQVVHP